MTAQRNEVHFHRVSERTPGWIWQALYAAQKDARSGAVPVVIAGPQDRRYMILDIDTYNALATLVSDKEDTP